MSLSLLSRAWEAALCQNRQTIYDGGSRLYMLRIRLRRVGAKKAPSYRIVVADSRSPRDGRFNEIIGFYDPLPNPSVMDLKEDRAKYWLSKGAQPSEAVVRILQKHSILPTPTYGANEGTH